MRGEVLSTKSLSKDLTKHANKVLMCNLWVSYIFGLRQEFWKDKPGEKSKVVLKKKKRKQGLDFWMKNKPMVLKLLKVWRVFPKGLGWG
jgi:hypothetical protein